MSVDISADTFRTTVAYRSTGPGGVHACGFVLTDTGDPQPCRNQVLDHYMAVYLLRGSGRLIDRQGQAHTLAPGCMAQVPAGACHTFLRNSDDQWAYCFIHIDTGFVSQLALAGCIDPDRPVLRPGLNAQLVRYFDQIVQTLKRGPDDAQPFALLAAHQLLLDVRRLDEQSRLADPMCQTVDRACRVLSDDQAPGRTTAAAARLAELKGGRFRKVFCDRTGLTPGDYRIRRRIDRARELILERRLTNRQAAAAAGCDRGSAFRQQFKHVTGLTPDAFRVSV